MKSIYELTPIDTGGRLARNGFNYQDHVGAGFCLEMLNRADLEEVWFETHDDITLLWRNASGMRVEFVQVKAHNPSSRWSISSITARDTGQGSSLLEKSLSQHRCREEATFRVVTSYDVTGELSVLKHELGSIMRLANAGELNQLIQRVQSKFNGDVIVSESGKDISYWISNCLWDKRPDTTDDVENTNRLMLEQIFKSRRRSVIPEHRDELYQKLLAWVRDASSKNTHVYADCHKLTRTQAEKWLDEQLAYLMNYGNSENPLRDKMQAANLPDPMVQVAQDLRWRYTEARLASDFYGNNALRLVEEEVMSLIPRLQREQYGQSDSLNSLAFHGLCIEELNKIVEKQRIQELFIPGSLVTGFFYQVVNRCLMRFTGKN